MAKTYDLRVIIGELLNRSTGEVYYEEAKDPTFPYKVYSFDSVDLDNPVRDDLILHVDVWHHDRGMHVELKELEAICDSIEKQLNCNNAPSGTTYPTFYKISRQRVPDEDKSIKHRLLKFQIQNYYTGA